MSSPLGVLIFLATYFSAIFASRVTFSLDQASVDLGWARIGVDGMSALREALADPSSSVQHINLSNNFLDDECLLILGDILKLPSRLTSLNLANNEISVDAALSLARGLQGNKGLQRLYLSHTSLQAEGAKLILDAIGTESTLTVLDISHCNIGDQGAVAVGELLKRNTSLETLTIYSNDIRTDGAKALFGSLHGNSNIKRLYYGPGNQFGNMAGQLLSDFLIWRACTLQTLDLSGTDLSERSLRLIGDALKQQSSLLELALRANDLSKPGPVKRFFNDLSGNAALRLLDVSACHMDAGVSYALATLVANNSVLDNLNLGFNRLRSNGANVILAALKDNTILKKLDLSGNLLQSSFLDSLIDNFTLSLEVLSMGQNSIGDKGLIALVNKLTNNTSLKRLQFDLYNDISDKGASHVAKVLLMSPTTTLEYIDLSGNKISDKGAKQILLALSHRYDSRWSMIEVKLSGNRISSELMRAVSLLKKNPVQQSGAKGEDNTRYNMPNEAILDEF